MTSHHKIYYLQFQRAISKIGNPDLWFLHTDFCLMMFNICMKIHEDCFLSYRADTIKSHFYYFQFQMVINPKTGNPELLFLHSAYHLMLVIICVKFHEDILRAISGIVHAHHSCGGKQGKLSGSRLSTIFKFASIQVSDTLTSGGYFRVCWTK